MDTRKQLIVSIIKFLKSEIESDDINQDGKEALVVSVEVLENTYKIEESDMKIDEPSLLEIFNASSLRKTYSKEKKPASDEDKLAAEKLKANGNEKMKEEKYAEAVQDYSEAIDLDSLNAVYFCNRAAAYTKLNENIKAIADCQKALSIDPKYSKAYGRLGLVYMNEKNYEKAIKAYEKAIELEPENHSYKNNLELAKVKSATTNQDSSSGGGGFGGGGGGGAPGANPLANMDLNSLLSNPAVMNLAQSFMQNPQMQNMFSSMMGGGGQQNPSQDTRPTSSEQDPTTTPTQNQQPPNLGGMFPQGMDFSNIMSATQQFANQMREQNPDLVDNLRAQFRQGNEESDSANQERPDQDKTP